MTVVVDSVVLIGALLRRDAWHERALPILRAMDEGKLGPVVVTDFVLAETLNFVHRKGSADVARDALARFERGSHFRITRIDDASFTLARDEVFPEARELSFVDALTVAWMRSHRARKLYSFDEGFDGVKGVTRVDRA
jgi:predicted nucleic acid-binding protein